jgi:hypothetical protein
MKKTAILISLISLNAFALDMSATKALGAKAMEKGKDMAAACKSEQLEYCKAYTQMEPLKECLTKNKEKLSPCCKASMGL